VNVVLDASALLALLNAEPGADRVAAAVSAGAIISAVNFSEVVAKLADGGVPAGEARDILLGLGLEVRTFDETQAYLAGSLRSTTRLRGLSLGDRCCLAVGLQEGSTVLTADRGWRGLVPEAKVEIIR